MWRSCWKGGVGGAAKYPVLLPISESRGFNPGDTADREAPPWPVNLPHAQAIGNAIGAPYALEYYLGQRVYLLIQYPLVSGRSFSKPDLKNLEFLHFIVTNWREPEIDTLTPENQRFFLYSKDAYVGG